SYKLKDSVDGAAVLHVFLRLSSFLNRGMRDTGGSRGGEWAAGRPFGFALVSEPAVSDPRSPISDSQIQTDSDLQTQFVQQNLRRIFLLIYRVVGNVDDAQDLTQETFIKALQRQSQLKDLEKAASWLSRIAANTAIDFLRRKKRLAFTDGSELAETRSSPAESPEQMLLRGE